MSGKRHAQQAQAGLRAGDEARVGNETPHHVAIAHKGQLQHQHDERERNQQPEQREQAVDDAGVGSQRERERQKAQQCHVGVGQEDADDDGGGEAQFDDGIQAVQQRIARHVVDDVNHGGPSPR